MKCFSRTRRAIMLASTTAALGVPYAARGHSGVTRIVVGFPPGGTLDFVARAITQPLGKELGQSVIVENRPGANGAMAADYVSRSPDVSTLWLTSVGAVAISPSLNPKLPYDPERDLVPVSLVVKNVEALVVAPSSPHNTLAEFVAAARKPSTRLTLASSGVGSVPHLAVELLNDVGKLNILHVPYKGGAPALTDVMAGHVDGYFSDIPGVIGFIRSGKLKPIGVTSSRRHPLLPEVRTFDEMGLPGVDADNWNALFAPKGTSAADIERVNAALRRVLSTEAVKSLLEASGAQPAPSTPAELSALLKQDLAKWGRVIKAKNIKAD
jgi:tripartite-type tricarboxylate transporter receptor subunit TctC